MKPELYEQANKNRLHQDTLRWNLFAGYVAFLVGVVGFLKVGTVPEPLGIATVVAANILLIVLAVESYYYNLFSAYVSYCEERLLSVESSTKSLTHREYAAREAKSLSPNHLSFSLAMVVVVCCNAGLVAVLAPSYPWLHAIGPLLFLCIRFMWQPICYPFLCILLGMRQSAAQL